MQKRNLPNFQIKIFKKDGTVQRLNKAEKRRVSYFLQAVQNSEVQKIVVKAIYGEALDNFGQKEEFSNVGVAYSLSEARNLISSFYE